MDRKLLLAVIDKFFGGPVGLDNLAAAIGEKNVKPLRMCWQTLFDSARLFAAYTAWAMATTRAWNHFGITPPEMP